MNTTQMLIQQSKDLLGVESDYGLAKRLNWSRQAVSNYQRGERHLDVDACFDLAELLGKDPAAVIAAVEAERATKPEAREAWIQRLKQLGGVAATIIFTIACSLPGPVKAADFAGAHTTFDAVVLLRITVFRSARTYAARALAGLSIRFRRIFQQSRGPAFAATALS